MGTMHLTVKIDEASGGTVAHVFNPNSTQETQAGRPL